MSKELGESNGAQFLLDVGEEQIIEVMTEEDKLSKEQGELKRIPISVLNLFWALKNDS